MKAFHLLLTFELQGAPEVRTQKAARISLDGKGALVVYGERGEVKEHLRLAQLRSFAIQPVTAPARNAPTPILPRALPKLRTRQLSHCVGYSHA